METMKIDKIKGNVEFLHINHVDIDSKTMKTPMTPMCKRNQKHEIHRNTFEKLTYYRLSEWPIDLLPNQDILSQQGSPTLSI